MACADSTPEQKLAALDNASLAQNSYKGYEADWRMFERWCKAQQLAALPASVDTLAMYIALRFHEPRKVSTITRHVAAVAYIHRREKVESPVTPRIRELLRAARRIRGDEVRRVRPLLVSEAKAICQKWASVDTPTAIRNRAVVLIGFASALRSASLVELQLADVEFASKGVKLHIRREKTDQMGKGRYIGIPHGEHQETDPVDALRSWVTRRGAFPGPLFTRAGGGDSRRPLQAEQICRIVQDGLTRIGRDPSEYGSHSLRAGFVTEAAEAGCNELLIAAQTGHRDLETLRAYFRRSDLFRANPCAAIGL